MKTTTKPRAQRKPAPRMAGQEQPRPAPGVLTDALRAAIKDSGLSAYRLERMSGVDIACILRFTSGDRDLTLSSADKLAGVLGLELVPRRRRR